MSFAVRNHGTVSYLLILVIFIVHISKSNSFSIPRIVPNKLHLPKSKATIPIATGCAYVAYSALTKRRLQKRFLGMEILSQVAAVDSTKRASDTLPDLIHQMKLVKSNKKLGQIQEKVNNDEFESLWSGYLLYDCALCTRLKDGWYTTGILNERKASIDVHVTNEGQNASVYIPKTDTPKPSVLFAVRKPCTIVEDPDEKLGWQRYLQKAVPKSGDDETSEDITNISLQRRKVQPGAYRFMYREYVTQEEIWAMMVNRGAFSPIRPTQDSTLVFQPDGHCYMEDVGRLFGIFPTKTHNTGKWSDTKIEWKTSSLQLGWKFACKKMEIKSVTEVLLSAPWDFKVDKNVFGQDDVLLMHRPDKGWLVWSRQTND